MMTFNYVEQTTPQQGSGNYGKFGLNQKVDFVKFAFNPNGGANNTAKECIDFEFKIGEQSFRHRFFPMENAYENGVLKALKDFDDKELARRIFNVWTENILNISRCFVQEEELKNALSKLTGNLNNFQNFAKTIEALINRSPKRNTIKLDVFLEYQKKIGANQNRTFLTFGVSEGQYPEGICVTEHIEGDFKEIKDDKGLRYETSEGYVHPISRSAFYLRDTNKKAKKQELNTQNTVGDTDVFGESDSSFELPF